ncbi:MAG: carbohydrate kinase family protein [Ktedonobacteraceae bacterium]|nr:carbohydrate kinase family protein [Ktedonobacteraceae bacterium]
MADILCFGNLQFDVLCRPVTTLPAPGELRMIEAIDFMLSGNGGSVSAVLARLGLSVELAGYSGADIVGAQFRHQLQELGVGIDKLLRHSQAGTGTSVITLAPDGERSILYVNGANALFDLKAVPDDWLQGKRVVYVGSVFVLPQYTGEAVGALLARARAYGATTVLNICWNGQRDGLSFLQPALAETDYFILNREEGVQLTGQAQIERIFDVLQAVVRGQVVLTLGADGCCLRDAGDGAIHHIPAVPVRATDCTGAGDSFVAGFIAGLVSGRSAREAARLGCHTAAFTVTGPGAYPRIPLLEEVLRLSEM